MNFRCLLALSLILTGWPLGCGSPDPADLLAEANDTNIQRVANLYQAYQSRHNWRGPEDEEEFKAFLRGWNPQKLARIGVDSNAIDDVFISARDKQPFRIRYSIPGHVMGSDAPVVFETTGVDGKRMVGFLNMTTREVDAVEYDRLWTGAADPAENTAPPR